jgi:hypothetical protein
VTGVLSAALAFVLLRVGYARGEPR